jgi:hypothetical protein
VLVSGVAAADAAACGVLSLVARRGKYEDAKLSDEEAGYIYRWAAPANVPAKLPASFPAKLSCRSFLQNFLQALLQSFA